MSIVRNQRGDFMGVEKKKVWEDIRLCSKTVETNIDPLERKRTGSYYTDLELTDVMMHELVQNLIANKRDITECRLLEPCVGTGNFVFSYLKEISTLSLSTADYQKVLDNIYVADINDNALKAYQNMLATFVRLYWNIDLDECYFKSHIGKGLLIDVSADELHYTPITEVFPSEVIGNGFDIVVTNPPYKNLKAEKGHYPTYNDYKADKIKYASIAKIVSRKFRYSVDGVLNLYKLFVEEIIDAYANANAFVSLLIPASILSDKTCQKLRTYILKNQALLSVKMIPEGSGYIDAQQALCALLIQKGKKTDKIQMTKDFCLSPEETTSIKIEDILSDNTGNAIMTVTGSEYVTLRKMRQWPVVKDLPYIINFRGELDLTSNRASITTENTGYPLLRGRNIGYYCLSETNEYEYASTDFVANTKKQNFIKTKRIICQQIANMHKERRVTFALVNENMVLANSCNFISVEKNNHGISIYTLLGLFNSRIINWLFKLTSSNNHINNYEIDSFPVPVGSPVLYKVDELVCRYLETKEESLIDMIENTVAEAYGIKLVSLSDQERIIRDLYVDIKAVLPNITVEMSRALLKGEASTEDYTNGLDKFEKNVVEGIVTKYRKIAKDEVLNHTTFKLSDLDLEMIKSVPPGGSWKDIPNETVVKSKRLLRITQTGGRTTLYGRIDYDKPSYTITTYFNRPGNGTYVHPIHERVLSVREAARFQCFPDSYLFFGNKNQLLKQVGNAVPTVLAYQIAKKIIDITGCSRSIDLFCGAGGMTVGFKAAGIKSVLSNDIEESACTTLKINNPEIPVLCGDITQADTKDAIVNAAKKSCADIICGGPPCQGFSMAGLRLTDDPRNQLFKEFIDVVNRIKPKVVVFENVEGLLSYQGGKTYEAIHSMFSEIGYDTEGRTLMANDYAVPQKRKRVIIICTHKDLNITPSKLFPSAITQSSSKQITARETIADLEKIECSENAVYTGEPTSDIVKLFRAQITYEDFINAQTENQNCALASDNTLKTDQSGQICFAL